MPKNLPNSSYSSISPETVSYKSIISLMTYMIYENTATPKTSITTMKSLSKSLLGLKSPKPVVDKEVI